MSYKVFLEVLELRRRNESLGRLTTRKLFYLYRCGTASMLVECWGWEPGKGFMKAFSDEQSLRMELNRRASKEGITKLFATDYELVSRKDGELDGELEFDTMQSLTDHLRKLVDRDATMPLNAFTTYLTRSGTAIYTEPTVPFPFMWNIESTQEKPDIGIEEEPVVQAAYAAWGDFA